MIYYLIVAAIVSLITYVYVSNKRKEEYWAKRGIPFYKGPLGLGYTFEFFIGKRTIFHIVNDIYSKYPNAPVIATNNFFGKALIVKDPDNVQQVLAGDFNTFNHRGLDVNGDVDLLADNILFMNGIRWKLTRQKFTPLFTSSKLRNMYYIMNRSAQDFVEYLKENPKKENAFDTLSTFCSAAIGASVFGIGTKSTMESPFLDMARKAAANTFTTNFKFALAGFSSRLFKLLKIQFFSQFESFFIGSMKKVIQMRKEDKVKKHDFAELCLDVQKNGTMRDPVTGYEIEPTYELVSAQAFFFFVAGVEPSANSMFFTLYELAKNPDILKRVHKQIDELFETNNGEITHEHIMQMEYLDHVIDEAMRIHPPIASLLRKSTQSAVLTVGNVPVDKDVTIEIPVFAIHHDPKHYPNPEVFDPERFTPEAKLTRPNYTHMPFGEGMRMCLGIRFARLQVKTGLVHLLRHFTIKLDDTTRNTKVTFVKSPIQLRSDNIDYDFVQRDIL